eukprot:150120_1
MAYYRMVILLVIIVSLIESTQSVECWSTGYGCAVGTCGKYGTYGYCMNIGSRYNPNCICVGRRRLEESPKYQYPQSALIENEQRRMRGFEKEETEQKTGG